MDEPKTWYDHVWEYWPEATEEACQAILWERTSFPFAGPAELKEQLDDYMSAIGKRRRNG